MKHIALIPLLALGLLAQPIYAGGNMDVVKKVVRIGWHAGKLAIGVSMIAYHTPLTFMYTDGHGDFSCSKLGDQWRKCTPAERRKFCAKELWQPNLYYSLWTCLLGFHWSHSGIKGLNRELKISEGVKKLADRIRKSEAA